MLLHFTMATFIENANVQPKRIFLFIFPCYLNFFLTLTYLGQKIFGILSGVIYRDIYKKVAVQLLL